MAASTHTSEALTACALTAPIRLAYSKCASPIAQRAVNPSYPSRHPRSTGQTFAPYRSRLRISLAVPWGSRLIASYGTAVASYERRKSFIDAPWPRLVESANTLFHRDFATAVEGATRNVARSELLIRGESRRFTGGNALRLVRSLIFKISLFDGLPRGSGG